MTKKFTCNGVNSLKLFDHTLASLEHALNFSARKNEIISNNIANNDTPFYKAKEVKFKDYFTAALKNNFENRRTHEKHFTFQNDLDTFKIMTNRNTSFNHNGNNVDIDKEMTSLVNNQIYYRGLVDQMNKKYEQLQTVIRGGR